MLTIAFSLDGAVLASGGEDGSIRLWDTETGAILGQPLTGHHRGVFALAFSSDGKHLTSVSEDNTIALWDAQKGIPSKMPVTHRTDSSDPLCSPNATAPAFIISQEKIQFWNNRTQGPSGQSMTGYRFYQHIALSPDGKVLAVGVSNNTIQLWDTQARVPLGKPLTGHSDSVGQLVFSSDSKVLASASHDNTIRLWDVEAQGLLGKPMPYHDDDYYGGADGDDLFFCIAFSPDDMVLASGTVNGHILLWDTKAGTLRSDVLEQREALVHSVAFSPDGKLLASVSDWSRIQLWDAQTGRPLGKPLISPQDTVEYVVFSPSGNALASGAFNKTIRLWDIRKREEFSKAWTDHETDIASIAFSPDGDVLASGCLQGKVQLWDAGTGRQLCEPLISHSDGIRGVLFSPDGKTLVSRSDTLVLWDVQTRAPLVEPLNMLVARHSPEFSPDSKMVAIGHIDRLRRCFISLLATQTGRVMWQSPSSAGARHYVNALAFSPDGTILASAAEDKIIKLWNTQRGTLLGEWPVGLDICSLRFSHEGTAIASISYHGFLHKLYHQRGGEIQLWDIQTRTTIDSKVFTAKGRPHFTSVSADGISVVVSGTNQRFLVRDKVNRHTCGSPPHGLCRRTVSLENHWVTCCSPLFWLPTWYWDTSLRRILLCNGRLAILSGSGLFILDTCHVLDYF